MRTAEEVQKDIDSLTSARLELAQGKSISSITIGESDFSRSTVYRDIDLKLVEQLLSQLQEELANILGETSPLSGFTTNIRTHAIKVRRGF